MTPICGQSWKAWTGGNPERRYDLCCRLEPGHPGDHAWYSHINVLVDDDDFLDPPGWVSSHYHPPVNPP